MVCPECGKELKETAKFCQWCGAKLTDNAPAEVSEPEDSIPADEIAEEQPSEESISEAETETDELSAPDEQVNAEDKASETETDVPEEEAAEEQPAEETLAETDAETDDAAVTAEEASETENAASEEETAAEQPSEIVAEASELAVEFSESDDLFVVSEQPVPAAEAAAEENTAVEARHRTVRFSARQTASIIAAVLLASLCIFSIYYIPTYVVPLKKYQNAEELFRDGYYDAAAEAFAELGDYENSRDYIERCRYESVVQLMDSGKYEEAAEAFAALDGYADSDALAAECLILSAEEYIRNGDYDAAISAYYAAGKTDLADDTAKARAAAFAEAGDYRAAAEAAAKYDREEAIEYLYLGAEKAMQDGDMKTAAEGFASLGDYKDSQKLAKECLYDSYAAEYRSGELSEKTVRAFRRMGNYRDSKELYIQAAYKYANASFESGNYYDALMMFRNCGTYEDSVTMLYRSRYELGKSLEKSDPASALSIFSLLGNYSDSQSRKKSAASRLGANASKWYADGFTSADGYYTSEFLTSDTLTISCTAGTDSPSGTVTLVVTFEDSEKNSVSADCENVRNGSSFSANVPLSSAAEGKAEVTVSVKDSGEIIRKFEIEIEK